MIRKHSAIAFSALALACSAAYGQSAGSTSTVTLYGRVNTTFEVTKVEGEQRTNQVVDNSSRLGVRGTEDLGGGTSAIFQIESRIRSDTGGTGLATRETWVGLKGGFGTVKLGRVIPPGYFATYDYISMHNHDTGNSSDAFIWIPAIGDFFNNNSLYYSTPTFGGFTAEASYSFLNEQGSNKRRNNFGGALSYDQGPLHVGFNYMQTQDKSSGTDEKKDTSYALAALYDFKAVVFGALYDRTKDSTNAKRNYWRLSAMVPVGNLELHANYGQAGDFTGRNDGGKQGTLGLNYNLSKRTKVYGFYTYVDNDQGGNLYGFLANTGKGDYNRSVAVGVRHNF